MFPDPKKSPLFGNGYHYPPHLASMPFMPLGHPMMSMAMANQMNLRPDAPGLPHITAEHRYIQLQIIVNSDLYKSTPNIFLGKLVIPEDVGLNVDEHI